MTLILDGKLFLAPLGDNIQVRRIMPISQSARNFWLELISINAEQNWQRVLDVGTGTGIWAM